MNILAEHVSGTDPAGAAALLGYAAPVELERFQGLEDGLWERASLGPAVLECVRLRSARIRGCRFCAGVRVSAAFDDGLAEEQLDHLDDPSERDVLSREQRGALHLVDRYLLDPRRPGAYDRIDLADVLGSRGVVEVLVACGVFASADLRIALGENAPPVGSGRVERRDPGTRPGSVGADWPHLTGPIVVPGPGVPHLDDETARLLAGLRGFLWDGQDLPDALIAACVVRAAQLLGVGHADPGYPLMVPPEVERQAPAADVAAWTDLATGLRRDVLALGEQLWLDPSGVDDALTQPLVNQLSTAGVIRTAWKLIWIGQLHRIAAVLVADGEPTTG